MKVIQVVAGIAHASSGTSTVMPRICECIADAGCQVELHTINPLPRLPIRNTRVHGYDLGRFVPRQFGYSHAMFQGLRASCMDADIVQTNGLWMYPNICSEWARRNTNCKFVVMPHGTLSAWALNRSRMKKWVCSCFGGQGAALRRADMLIATGDNELEEIRSYGLNQPVAVIPNGVDIPDVVHTKCQYRQLLFLSRIHPKKGVDLLLRAWRSLQDDFPEWRLRIVGPLDDYANEMIRYSKSMGCLRCEFLGELLGDPKQRVLGESECLVLPTYSENFGMVVAEALAAGTMAICTKGAPWKGLNTNKCGMWVDIGEEPLYDALRECMGKHREELVEIGLKGREWIRRDFSWGKVGAKMKAAYEWLLDGGERPEYVRI